MNLSRISSAILAGLITAGTAQAGINTGTSNGILNSREKCASALNSYLSYRHANATTDAYKVSKLENQVDSMCDGYQIKLVESNGVTRGLIELAD